jgi:hypothetical protein
MTRLALLVVLCRFVLSLSDAYSASLGTTTVRVFGTQRMGWKMSPSLRRMRTRRRQEVSSDFSRASGGGSADTTVTLRMGLYDQPLPPRPPPVPPKRQGRKGSDANYEEDDDDDDEDEDEDDDEMVGNKDVGSEATATTPINLFEFDAKGKEVNDLLPNLGRWLDRGVGCYYEATDRPVVSLVRRTSCSPSDACWALEACKGDVTEAWTRISVARRMKLEGGRLKRRQPGDDTNGDEGSDAAGGSYQMLDEDVLELEMEEEFLELKQQRMEEQKRQDINDMFKGDKDQDWLPRQTKGPVDDEPWFTG